MKGSWYILLIFCALAVAIDPKIKEQIIKDDSSSMVYGLLIPHSHDDVGWLETIDDYYSSRVKLIYDTVIEALFKNPSRRFIAVEMAYFSRWWSEATPLQQQQCRKLVKSGQLEFVIGGWSMEDEACTTYSANIDQMTEGHQFIFDTFGVAPRFSWQIDPFGASNVVHHQFAQMGFDATIISRIDYTLKDNWSSTHNLQYIWKPSPNQPETQIFTHVLDLPSYTTPVQGIGWSSDNPPVTPQNIDYLSQALNDNIQSRRKSFNNNIFLFPFGGDFDHWKANADFDNMDLLIEHVNANSKKFNLTLQYATLAEYFEVLHARKIQWNFVGSVDFLPYTSEYTKYWSGYFSSRSALKGWIRSRESLLRNSEIMHAVSRVATKYQFQDESEIDLLRDLRRSSGEATHHDAVTGTSEIPVVQMYDQHLADSSKGVEKVIENSMKLLENSMKKKKSEKTKKEEEDTQKTVNVDYNLLKNLDNSSVIPVQVFNSLGWRVQRFVSIPVPSIGLKVLNGSMIPVPSQINPSLPSYPQPCSYEGTCGFPTTQAPYELFFRVDLPPVGYATYYIATVPLEEAKKSLPSQSSHDFHSKGSNDTGFLILENQFLSLNFSKATGHLQSVRNIKSDITVSLEHNFYSYDATQSLASEGAYIFAPGPDAAVDAKNPIEWHVIQGQNVIEVRQVFTPPCQSKFLRNFKGTLNCGLSQVYRIYSTQSDQIQEIENFIELLQSMGPIADETDLITRFNTDIDNIEQNQPVVYTDNNCFEIRKRVFDPSRSNPVAGNYFPVTCTSFIRDIQQGAQLTLLTDRTHGGGSSRKGQVELMLHRNIITTDYQGPFEMPDSDRLENVQTLVLVDQIHSSTVLRHKLQYYQQFPPSLVSSTPVKLLSVERPSSPLTYSAMLKPLPDNIHLLSLSFPSSNSKVSLFRLAHVFELNEDMLLSSPVTLDLDQYFSFGVVNIEERSLTGVLAAKEANDRWKWSNSTTHQSPAFYPKNGSTQMTLVPSQIRTFYISFM